MFLVPINCKSSNILVNCIGIFIPYLAHLETVWGHLPECEQLLGLIKLQTAWSAIWIIISEDIATLSRSQNVTTRPSGRGGTQIENQKFIIGSFINYMAIKPLASDYSNF